MKEEPCCGMKSNTGQKCQTNEKYKENCCKNECYYLSIDDNYTFSAQEKFTRNHYKIISLLAASQFYFPSDVITQRCDYHKYPPDRSNFLSPPFIQVFRI